MRIIGSVELKNVNRDCHVSTQVLYSIYENNGWAVVPHKIGYKYLGWAIYIPHVVSSFFIATKNHNTAIVICRYLASRFDVKDSSFSDIVNNDYIHNAIRDISWNLSQNDIKHTCNVNYPPFLHVTGRD